VSAFKHKNSLSPLPKSIERIRSELERSDNVRRAAAAKEKDALERLQSQMQAEQKLRAGPPPSIIFRTRVFSPHASTFLSTPFFCRCL
jgi:hypothetical protein